MGFLRGRYVMPEMRSMCMTISRLGTLVISVMLLTFIHHSPMMMMLSCAVLNGTASYLQNTISAVHDAVAFRGDTTDDEADASEL